MSDNLKKMGGLGLLGMLVSEKYGGENAGTVVYPLALAVTAYAGASTAVILSAYNSIGLKPFLDNSECPQNLDLSAIPGEPLRQTRKRIG